MLQFKTALNEKKVVICWEYWQSESSCESSLVFLVIINLTNGLRLHQFLGTKTIEGNKSLKTETEPISKITNEQEN